MSLLQLMTAELYKPMYSLTLPVLQPMAYSLTLLCTAANGILFDPAAYCSQWRTLWPCWVLQPMAYSLTLLCTAMVYCSQWHTLWPCCVLQPMAYSLTLLCTAASGSWRSWSESSSPATIRTCSCVRPSLWSWTWRSHASPSGFRTGAWAHFKTCTWANYRCCVSSFQNRFVSLF